MDDYLIHYGVLGMKWGVRKDRRASLKESKKKYKEDVKSSKEKKSSQIKTAKSKRLSRDAKIEANYLSKTKGKDKAKNLLTAQTNPTMRNFNKGLYSSLLAQTSGIPLAAAIAQSIHSGSISAALSNPLVGALSISSLIGAAAFGPDVYKSFSKKLKKKKELMLKELNRN